MSDKTRALLDRVSPEEWRRARTIEAEDRHRHPRATGMSTAALEKIQVECPNFHALAMSHEGVDIALRHQEHLRAEAEMAFLPTRVDLSCVPGHEIQQVHRLIGYVAGLNLPHQVAVDHFTQLVERDCPTLAHAIAAQINDGPHPVAH
ncbi:hypothetical protein [Salinisphaera hydrothermalis]|uniref:hypothetical protein n=1 Tax=Salinisphaera hydrothermalis TaxID=563188 RepID=UPI00333E4ADE